MCLLCVLPRPGIKAHVLHMSASLSLQEEEVRVSSVGQDALRGPRRGPWADGEIKTRTQRCPDTQTRSLGSPAVRVQVLHVQRLDADCGSPCPPSPECPA